MNKYVEEFLALNCSPDILEIVKPINNIGKEISESMAVIKQLRKLTLKNTDVNYVLIDLCAGNALTSVLASFLYKNIIHAYAVDIYERQRDWHKVKGFAYHNCNINDTEFITKLECWVTSNALKYRTTRTELIIIGVHACRETSKRIIEIYNKINWLKKHLILMPCCVGNMKGYSLPDIITQKIGTYMKWCLYLYNLLDKEYGVIEINRRMVIDNFCMSPKNTLIISDT